MRFDILTIKICDNLESYNIINMAAGEQVYCFRKISVMGALLHQRVARRQCSK